MATRLHVAALIPFLLLTVASWSAAAAEQKPRPEVIRKPVLRTAKQPAVVPDSEIADLSIGGCEVRCSKGAGYSTALCAQEGYRSDFNFQAISTTRVRNTGTAAASFSSGSRVWTIEGEDPASGRAPATGLYLAAGADAPAPLHPVKTLLKPAPGAYHVRFVLDPDQQVAESNENNNSAACNWTVVPAPIGLVADVAITALSVSPDTASRNTEFHYRFTLENLGNADATAVTITCTPGVNQNLPRVDAGSRNTYSYKIPNTASMASGSHTLTCTAGNSGGGDSNPGNNSRSAAFGIQ